MFRALMPLVFGLCFALVPLSGALAQIMITQTPAPADWGQATLSGIGIATHPGWIEVERRDDPVTFFRGDLAKRTGPGVTLMLDSDPTQMLKDGDFEDLGEVVFDNGALFRRYRVGVSPESGVAIAGEFLVSSVPVVNGEFLMAGALGYNVKIDAYRAIFDTIFASLGVPAPGEALVQTALNGAFDYVLPDGWETGSYDQDEVLILDQDGGQGKVSLMRHALAGAGSHRSGWYIPSETPAVPVMFLGHPALSYEWHGASKYYSDGKDSDEITRLFVFESCLANGDTGSVEVTGMPDFHTSAAVMRLLDHLAFAPNGTLGAACRAVDLPEGAPVGAPIKGRPEASNFTLWIPSYTRGDGWRTETHGDVSFALPISWTGSAGVWMSSRGEYQLGLFQTQDAPVPMAKRAELRLPDGTRFFRFTIPDGTRAISATPIGPQGHLVIDVTGTQMDGVGIVDILGTLNLPTLTPSPAQTG
ncbi:MAG: hypothetical protein Q7J57_09955, partial [Gemmobacter sp.]|nr:hypothetical protein [Gemmobacter sp.]